MSQMAKFRPLYSDRDLKRFGRKAETSASSGGLAFSNSALQEILSCGARLIFLAAPFGFGQRHILEALAQSLEQAGKPAQWSSPGSLSRADRKRTALVDALHQTAADEIEAIISLARNCECAKVVVALSQEPSIDLLAAELSGELRVFRSTDLTITTEEIRGFLESNLGARAAEDEIDAIDRWTRGWPIAVQLCTSMIGRRRPSQRDLDRRAMPVDLISRYLETHIVKSLDPDVVEFLPTLAALGRVSPDMLDEIVDPSLAQSLDCLYPPNIILVPGEDIGWFRLHPVVEDYLKTKRRSRPRVVDSRMLDAASAWAVQHGAIADAVDFLIQAGDIDRAEQLLSQEAEILGEKHGQVPRFVLWYDQIKASGREPAITIRLWRIWALIFQLRLNEAGQALAEARQAPPKDATQLTKAHLDKLEISLLARLDDPDAVLIAGNEWLSRWRAESFFAAAVHVLMGFAYQANCREGERKRSFALAWQAALVAESAYAQSLVRVFEALADLRCGKAGAAIALVNAEARSRRAGCDQAGSLELTACLVSARAHAETLDFDTARSLLRRAGYAAPGHGVIEAHIAALEARVILAEHDINSDAAVAELRGHSVGSRRYVLAAKVLTVDLLLRFGQTQEARDHFDSAFAYESSAWRLLGNESPLTGDETRDVEFSLAWLAFAERNLDRASALVSRLLPEAETNGRPGRQVTLLLLRAAIELALGHESSAIRDFTRAYRISGDNHLTLTAIRYSWPLRSILASEITGVTSAGYAIVEKARAFYGMAELIEDIDAIEHLTAREQEVLQYLDSGLTSSEISEVIGLGLSTTKWHIQNIYGKLAVRNRSGALAKARRLGLV